MCPSQKPCGLCARICWWKMMKSHFTTSVLHRKAFKGSVLVVRCLAWRHSKLHIFQVLAAGRTTNTFAWKVHTIYKIIFKSSHKNTNHLDRFASSKKRIIFPHNTPPAQARIHKETRSDSHCCIAKAMQWKAAWVSCWILKKFNAAFSVPTGWKEFAQMG